MKKFKLTFVLTVLMSMVGLQAFAKFDTSTEVEVGGLYYYLDKANNQAQVTSKSSGYYSGAIEIPPSIKLLITYSVTSIGERAFLGCSGLTSVTIPNSVTSIGGAAFSGCSGLTSVTIPNSVTSIGTSAFYGCSALTSVTIPNSVTSIGNYAFNGCSDLTSVTIPNSVTKIGNNAFHSCSNLTSVTIPNSVTSIGEKAFEGCSGLTSITIPNSVTSIGQSAFYGTACYNNQPDGLVYIDKWAYEYKGEMPAYTSVTIKEGTVGIADFAFLNCSGLTSVTIPNSVTSIGRKAFLNCSGLNKVIVKGIAAWCGISFKDYDENPLYYAKHLYSDDNTEITDLVIPDGVTSIGKRAFADCSGLTSVTIPNSVTSIGDYAFENCSGLNKVIVKDIAAWCKISFGSSANPLCYANHLYSDENTEITDLVIPYGVTSIRYHAFEGCFGLTSITIPNSVTSIGGGAFGSCEGLTSVTIPNSVTSIGGWAFSSCSGLTSVTIGNSVTSIDGSVFNGCSNLTSVTLNSNAIASKAYTSSNNIKNIFGGQVTEYIIGADVTSIGNYAFNGCSGLTSVTIPNSVTSIGLNAFSGCSGLTSITIPNSVTSIGGNAFRDCSGLTSVTALNPTPVTIDSYAFSNRANATLYVPKGSKDAYKAADYWKEFKEIIEIEPSAISSVTNEQKVTEVTRYNLQGRRTSTPERGINIIRMSDGTTRKVVVK